MYSLTKEQRRVLDFLIEFTRDNDGVSPTLEEISDHMGFAAKSSAHRLLTCLEERGHIRRLKQQARGIEVVRQWPKHMNIEQETDENLLDFIKKAKQVLANRGLVVA